MKVLLVIVSVRIRTCSRKDVDVREMLPPGTDQAHSDQRIEAIRTVDCTTPLTRTAGLGDTTRNCNGRRSAARGGRAER